VLFHDCSVKLEEQLQMVEELSEHFNSLARAVDVAEINLEKLRNSLQSETDRQISVWVHRAWTETLSLFGTEKEMQAQIERDLLLSNRTAVRYPNARTHRLPIPNTEAKARRADLEP
jgi:hypothetical protein